MAVVEINFGKADKITNEIKSNELSIEEIINQIN